MCFELLHSRLVDYLRNRVRSGEVTERGLARLAGVSQPHLHNVLKGARILSPAKADAVVTHLRLSAADLLVPPGHQQVPLAADPLGPGQPFPDLQNAAARVVFPASKLHGLACPAAVRLAADPEAPDIFHEGDTVLLEIVTGREPAESGYYAIEQAGCGRLRWVQAGRPADPGLVLRARVIWIGHYL